MSGILSIAQFRALDPDSGLSDSLLGMYLDAAQAIAEYLSGLSFGAEVKSFSTDIGSVDSVRYTIVVGSPVGAPGDSVMLLGNGAPADEFEIVDVGPDSIRLWAPPNLNPTKVLPIQEFVGKPSSGFVRVAPRPLFRVVSVKTRGSSDSMWADASAVTTLTSGQYEVYSTPNGLKSGVRLAGSAVPRALEGGPFLVKRMAFVQNDSVQVRYAAGWFGAVPSDLQLAAQQVVTAISDGVEQGAVYASENIDYYSYQNPSGEQLSSLPHSAIATFRRYSQM